MSLSEKRRYESLQHKKSTSSDTDDEELDDVVLDRVYNSRGILIKKVLT